MNKVRREELNKALERLYDAQAIVEQCLDEEQDYLDNIPENLQDSERYEKAESAVQALEDTISNIEDAISNIETAGE